MLNCQTVKNLLVTYLQNETEILQSRVACIASLPFKVLDGVNAEVYIEEISGGYLVHDGGRSLGVLESSGMLITDRKLELLGQLAKRLGASFDNGVFKKIAKDSSLQESVLSVGQCCSVSMFELLKHAPSTEEEMIRSRVRADVNNWAVAHGATIHDNKKVQGAVKQYTLDLFLDTASVPIGINILVPTYGAAVSADRYALQSLDLGKTSFKRLVVLVKPDKWKQKSRSVVSKMADAVAEIQETQGLFQDNITASLDFLVPAA